MRALARFYMAVVQGMAVQAIDGADTAELNAELDAVVDAQSRLGLIAMRQRFIFMMRLMAFR